MLAEKLSYKSDTRSKKLEYKIIGNSISPLMTVTNSFGVIKALNNHIWK